MARRPGMGDIGLAKKHRGPKVGLTFYVSFYTRKTSTPAPLLRTYLACWAGAEEDEVEEEVGAEGEAGEMTRLLFTMLE